MHMSSRVVVVILLLCAGDRALAQSGPEEESWEAYAPSTGAEAQADSSEAAEPAPTPQQDALPAPAATPADESPAPVDANPAPSEEQAPSLDESSDLDSGATQSPDSDDGVFSPVDSAITGTGTGLGCLAGGCGPSLFLGSGMGVCGVGYLLAVSATDMSGALVAMMIAVSGCMGCSGLTCGGPLCAGGAIIGGSVGAWQSGRNWRLPIVAGAPGLLLGLAGSGLLLAPIALGALAPRGIATNTGTAAALSMGMWAMLIGGAVASVAAGPVSLAGIIIADLVLGATQPDAEAEASSKEYYGENAHAPAPLPAADSVFVAAY